jgi:hypothetical protein
MGAYGLGTARSVQDYIDFSGVDYFNKKASGRALKHIVKEKHNEQRVSATPIRSDE